MTQLDLRIVLGGGPFAECGRPTGLYWDWHGDRLAVASSFEPLQWHGRDLQRGCALRFRVAVYDAPTLRRVAVLDRARFPINDVAFHPSKPIIAVATGSYDGGYYYEGELLLWNVHTGDVQSLLDENREVTRCHFDHTGQTLHLTLRPQSDWEDEEWVPERRYRFLTTTLERALWETPRPGSVVVHDLACSIVDATDVPPRHHSRGGYPPEDLDLQAELQRLALQIRQQYEPRWWVWDVAWTTQGDILAVRNGTALEHWTVGGARLRHLADPRDGVQLLPSPTGEVYVNLFSRIRTDQGTLEPRIECINVETGERRTVESIAFPAVLSMADSGAVLARDVTREKHSDLAPPSGRRTRDCMLLPGLRYPEDAHHAGDLTEPRQSEALDLGHYDLFNHYVRIDGAPHLYFLQGTPPTSWRSRWICRLHAATLQVERLFPVDWEAPNETYLRIDAAVYHKDGVGEALIVAYQRGNGRGLLQNGVHLVRRDLSDGHLRWTTALAAPVTALAVLPERNLVVFALSDGHVGLVTTDTGALQLLQRVILNAVHSVYLSLATQGDRILAGTADGRIVVSELNV